MRIIGADLQDPPELIPQMVGRWRQGVRGRVRVPVFECGRVLARTPYELRILQTFTGIVIL